MATIARPATYSEVLQWWRLRSRMERRALLITLGVLGALVAWLMVLQPVERDTELLARQLAAQRAALAEAQRQADDIATLTRNTPAPAVRDARSDLDAALARIGAKPIAIDHIDNQRLRVTFDAISFDTLTSLLAILQRNAHLRAVELTATGRVEPGQVRAEMTLAP